MSHSKTTEQLDVPDLQAHPVWEYVEPGDFRIVPVHELPVASLAGRLAGTVVRLRNGDEHWAVLGNVILDSPRQTKQFLTVWMESKGNWFALARYFDVDYGDRGPEQLARFLEMPVEEVFPIAYDLSAVAVGRPEVVVGMIPQEPEERLTDEALIALSWANGTRKARRHI